MENKTISIVLLETWNLHLEALHCPEKDPLQRHEIQGNLAVFEADVLAGRFKSVSGRHYVLHDPEKLTEYVTAWPNFGVKSII